MFLDFLNKVDIECNRDYSNYKKEFILLSLNKFLFNIEKAQELHRVQIRDKYEIKESNNIIEHFA